MRAALRGLFDVVLPEQVLAETRHHLPHPTQQAALDAFLAGSAYEELAMPSVDEVRANLDLGAERERRSYSSGAAQRKR
jgi:hypothetical protein